MRPLLGVYTNPSVVFHLGDWTRSQIQGQEFPPEARAGRRRSVLGSWAPLAPHPHSLCCAQASCGSSAPGRARTFGEEAACPSLTLPLGGFLGKSLIYWASP